MVWPLQPGIRVRRLWPAALIAICSTLWSPRASQSQDEPELVPGRAITRCQLTERHATRRDVPLTDRIPVLAEPANWLDVPGPRGERAEGWRGRHAGYRIFDRRGRLLHSLPDVHMPRWSPDGRWLAVSHWSRELPHQLALVEVATGNVIPIPKVESMDDCTWAPDSRRLAFIARSYPSGDSGIAGWLSIPDTSVHVVAQGLNWAFECTGMAWSADSRRFVALMHREYEHDDVRVTDLWLFGLEPGVCRLTATPEVEESNVRWLDDRRVMFDAEPADPEGTPSSLGTVLELPVLPKSPR